MKMDAQREWDNELNCDSTAKGMMEEINDRKAIDFQQDVEQNKELELIIAYNRWYTCYWECTEMDL